MTRLRSFTRLLALLFAASQCLFASTAWGSMIGTGEMLEREERAQHQERILGALKRDRAAAALERFGVAPAQVEERLDRLSDRELAQLADQADELPAGEGALGLLVFVLVLLIVLDLLGVTNVFPAIQTAQ